MVPQASSMAASRAPMLLVAAALSSAALALALGANFGAMYDGLAYNGTAGPPAHILVAALGSECAPHKAAVLREALARVAVTFRKDADLAVVPDTRWPPQVCAALPSSAREPCLWNATLVADKRGVRGCGAVLWKKTPPDRSCLLSEPLLLELRPVFFWADAWTTHSADSLVRQLTAFVNRELRLFREPDSGRLSRLGRARRQLLRQLTRASEYGSEHCERVSRPSLERFWRDFVLRARPVVIADAVDDWPAFTRWSDAFLRSYFADREVYVKIAPDGEFEGVEEAAHWETGGESSPPEHVLQHLESPDKVVVRPADASMRLGDLLDAMDAAAQTRLAHGREDSNVVPSFYMEYAPISSYLPELWRDTRSIEIAADFQFGMHPNLWLGDGHTLGKLHFDAFDNLMIMINGSKTFWVTDPQENERLYEGHIREATLGFNASTRRFTRAQLENSTSMVMSPVDLRAPDLERYPLFAGVRFLNCTVGRGEMLYLPAFWWHEVQSAPDIADPAHPRNIGVNIWYAPVFDKAFPCRTCRPDLNPAYFDTVAKYI